MADARGRARKTSPRKSARSGTMGEELSAASSAEPDGRTSPPAGAPSEDAIRRLAYERFLARGGASGYEVEDWLSAERELRDAPPEAADDR